MNSCSPKRSKNSYAEMILEAIENASKLGIQMCHPFLNSANGNCAFEGVIDNINSRSCFEESYDKSPDYYRSVWMEEIERIGYGDWNMGLSKSEWHEGFNLLKNSRGYEHCLGDLIVPAIAHAVRKNIMIFNTFAEAYPPVYVVSASVFGGSSTTNVPVCLAYNKYHYEQLVPKTNCDVQRTIDLSQKLLAGSCVEDIFTAIMTKTQATSTYDKNFPLLPLPGKRVVLKEKSNIQPSNCCLMTLAELKSIPVKKRTQQQQSRYKSLMYLESKEKLSKEQLEEKRKRDREKKMETLQNMNEEEKKNINTKQRERMKNIRQNLTDSKKEEEKRQQQKRMKDFRKSLDEDSLEKIKEKQRQTMKKIRHNMEDNKKVEEKRQEQKRLKDFRQNLDEDSKKKYKEKQRQTMKKIRHNMEDNKKEEEKRQEQKRIKDFRQSLDEDSKEKYKEKQRQTMTKNRQNMDESEKEINKMDQRQRMRSCRENFDEDRKESERLETQQRMKKVRENQDEAVKEKVNAARKLQRKKLSLSRTQKLKFKLNRKDRERKSCNSELKRLKKFFAATRYGPIFICSSCKQKMFQNWVCELDVSLITKLREKNREVFEKVFYDGLTNVTINICENGKTNVEPTKAYLCITCKRHLQNGRVPPMSVANGLNLVKVDPDLQLTELENNLIAKRILFQKIYQLPRSRMAACKDKLVNIPINDDDVMNTVNQFPRTPTEAGLLEVKLKRKIEYNNFHKKEYVNKDKIFRALEFLQKNNHPGYEFYDSIDVYENRCQKEDPDGYNLAFVYDDGIPKIMELAEYQQQMCNTERAVKKPEKEDAQDNLADIEQDVTRKFQFDYDRSVCMVDNYPEAALSEVNEGDCISFAPGQGKIPENILTSENWDIDAFPMKHPDGKNGLMQSRDQKLSDQYYFVQRLRNQDQRFATDPAYKFAAGAYLEKLQLQRNINVSFQRGKKSVLPTGQHSYSLEDGFSVFDKISNTPAYWKTAKYEMIAKLENLGPFQFFFTLSCADSRWDENFSSILTDLGISVHYNFDSDGNEQTMVDVGGGKCMPLREYLNEYVSESQHELIRKNVLNASRNYNHRVKAFINNIVLDKQNLMSVKYYSTKVEFQGRGAGHNHGVLWVDLEKMEYFIEDYEGNWLDLDDTLTKRFAEKKAKQDIKDILDCICHGNTENLDLKWDQKYIQDLFKLVFGFSEDITLTYSNILERFPLYGLSSAFRKFQTLETLYEHEENAIKNFAKKFTTCTLNPAMLAHMTEDSVLKKKSKSLLDTVKSVNIHSHTKTCRKYDTSCRFGFGKFPIWETLIAKPYTLLSKETQDKYSKILKNVRKVLDDEKTIQLILQSYNKEEESKEEYEINRKERILKVLNIAGLKSDEDHEMYKSALSMSKSGYTIILERDIDEMYVNSYNPEWARAWNGNHDIQICLDYFAIITYITEYYTKDDSGTIQLLLDALKNNPSQNLKDRMKVLMNTYIAARQMGETEVLYKIFPDFHLKDSNITTVFVPVSRKDQRSKFLLKVDQEMNYGGQEKVKIEGRDGFYVEKYDIISKYERREAGLEELSFSQFAKMYSPSWTFKETDIHPSIDENNDQLEENIEREIFHESPMTVKFDYIMSCSDNAFNSDHKLCKSTIGLKLPKYIKLKFSFPGEAPYMKKRKYPAVLRFHKFKQDTNPLEFFYSESLLYKPFKSEEELELSISNIQSADLVYYNSHIRCVKQQTMEFLDNVSEARHFAEEFQRNEQVGQELDPLGEQDQDDCEYEGVVEHPDFPNLVCENFEDDFKRTKTETAYKLVEIDTMDVLMEKTRKLDYYQKKVVEIGIRYAKSVVKSLKTKNPLSDVPKLMVHGGAGSGKSTVINILKQWIQLILQTSGDNPDCPYVFITAPTGTAAANIKGQTLHSAFGFNFGNEHFSLSDKKRDEKRSQLHNLKAVIID